MSRNTVVLMLAVSGRPVTSLQVTQREQISTGKYLPRQDGAQVNYRLWDTRMSGMYVTQDRERSVRSIAGRWRQQTIQISGRTMTARLALVIVSLVVTGCQTAPKRTVEFNAYEMSSDAANTAVFGHELLAPPSLDRSNAIRLGQLCAARSADSRGYSHIEFLEEAVVDRETGWEMPRFRVRLKARYVDSAADSAMGARDLMSVLTTELGSVDPLALNCG